MKLYHNINAIRIFISCSTKQPEIHALIREVVSRYNTSNDRKISTQLYYVFFVYNYEDLSSAQGTKENMQERYNKFIRDESDIVIAIFDNKIGKGTIQECNAAQTSIRHPLLYIHKPRGTKNRRDFQYQPEFDNLEKLRSLIKDDLTDAIEQMVQKDLSLSETEKKEIEQYDAFNVIIQQAQQNLQSL